MRVIAGKFSSRPLTAPPGRHTRPTSARLRETLFNVLAPRIEGSVFLDLYAGSGAVGIEALSRGAREAIFVEQAAPALNPRRVPAGQVFEFRYVGAGSEPARLRTRLSPEAVLWLRRDAGGAWQQEIEHIQWQPQPVRIVGAVQGSLYETLSDLIPDSILPGAERDRMIYDLADEVFGWEIDFTRDVVAGDHFAIPF